MHPYNGLPTLKCMNNEFRISFVVPYDFHYSWNYASFSLIAIFHYWVNNMIVAFYRIVSEDLEISTPSVLLGIVMIIVITVDDLFETIRLTIAFVLARTRLWKFVNAKSV